MCTESVPSGLVPHSLVSATLPPRPRAERRRSSSSAMRGTELPVAVPIITLEIYWMSISLEADRPRVKWTS